MYVDHCIGCVAQQVEDDLLQLNAVAPHDGKFVCEFRAKNNAIPLQVDR
jgi:hypothetical protein